MPSVVSTPTRGRHTACACYFEQFPVNGYLFTWPPLTLIVRPAMQPLAAGIRRP